jgi:RNA polymerase sigma-70 factor (ECF subfamily)
LQDEATLLERIGQYDTEALAQVYDSYYDRIYRYVYGFLGRVDAAEDLTANVFFRLLSAVQRGKSPRKNLSAWLYRVAHNLVVDAFRRKPPDELELAEWLESDQPEPAETVELRIQLDRVQRALPHLTEAQQQVIMLKFFQGMDSREAAAIMGKTDGAVDALQHRALRALRKMLNKGHGPGVSGEPASGKDDKDNVENGAERDNRVSMLATRVLKPVLALLYLASRRPGETKVPPACAQSLLGEAKPAWKVTR